ncbi:MAG: hypothetical protein SGARI_006458 [Bacillariaceae sp.]
MTKFVTFLLSCFLLLATPSFAGRKEALKLRGSLKLDGDHVSFVRDELSLAGSHGHRDLRAFSNVYNEDFTFPIIRYTPFNLLTERQQNIAMNLLEYTGASAWDNPMTNRMELMRLENVFEYLNKTMVTTPYDAIKTFFLVEMGYKESIWDCWINHYVGFSWSYYSNYNFNWTLMDLGWTQTTWDSNNATLAPPSESKAWTQLTDKEQTAAKYLCYNQDLWDNTPIGQWAPSQAPSDSPTVSPAPTNAPTPTPPPSESPTDEDFRLRLLMAKEEELPMRSKLDGTLLG